ncbi:VTT domain-containing protein [Paenibacillus glycanilyticus]|uniref:TVP38/TMEM64 family protein n=1 Tax=Paenibacillus glycanilyticus TaxID=126569 RepID=UPI00203B04D5|nr:VTT domain-containing protein [Paenibacillus glycanilyticus]MCM3631622.1 VTT domain-containing protein [Paenibacillus glycanilyticus]
MKKWLLILSYIFMIILIILYKEQILRWLQGDHADHLALLFSGAVLLALIPVIPYGLIAGIIGVKYGPVWGGFFNVLSSSLAAALQFIMVRFVFQEQGNRLLVKFKRIDHFTKLVEKNAFIAVLLARLLPFVPAALVNVYSAISRMRFSTFVAATLIGKIPVMFVFAFVGDQLFTNLGNVIWTVLIYMFFLIIVYLLYRVRKREE